MIHGTFDTETYHFSSSLHLFADITTKILFCFSLLSTRKIIILGTTRNWNLDWQETCALFAGGCWTRFTLLASYSFPYVSSSQYSLKHKSQRQAKCALSASFFVFPSDLPSLGCPKTFDFIHHSKHGCPSKIWLTSWIIIPVRVCFRLRVAPQLEPRWTKSMQLVQTRFELRLILSPSSDISNLTVMDQLFYFCPAMVRSNWSDFSKKLANGNS